MIADLRLRISQSHERFNLGLIGEREAYSTRCFAVVILLVGGAESDRRIRIGASLLSLKGSVKALHRQVFFDTDISPLVSARARKRSPTHT